MKLKLTLTNENCEVLDEWVLDSEEIDVESDIDFQKITDLDRPDFVIVSGKYENHTSTWIGQEVFKRAKQIMHGV